MAPYTGADADMQTRLATPWCNPGSYGHPSLCARPCIYIAKNGSCHVDGCDYCHMAHDLPVAKLNQRQRYVLQRLSVKVKMDLVLEAVRGGLHREGLTDQAESLLCLLEQEASKHSQQASHRDQRRQVYDLRKALSRMTVADTIHAVQDVLPEHVIQSFQNLRRALLPSVVPDPLFPMISKCELSLKEALALFPAPQAAAQMWIL
ncbi:unnamed protein product [Symbiodinium natans]|uniref:C3H1-type domain-containing protein n=1 Tax=Symbiodinium natans TaxID=878477 RepID=A0A812G0P1_9DINO|nr:unnamed protein product [Symbiodinium natans]